MFGPASSGLEFNYRRVAVRTPHKTIDASPHHAVCSPKRERHLMQPSSIALQFTKIRPAAHGAIRPERSSTDPVQLVWSTQLVSTDQFGDRGGEYARIDLGYTKSLQKAMDNDADDALSRPI